MMRRMVVYILSDLFDVKKPLIAMRQLLGRPGRPRHDAAGGMVKICQLLGREVRTRQDADVDGHLFCNGRDLSYSTSVGAKGAAAVVGPLRADITIPFGIDLPWAAGSAIAAACVDPERAAQTVELLKSHQEAVAS